MYEAYVCVILYDDGVQKTAASEKCQFGVEAHFLTLLPPLSTGYCKRLSPWMGHIVQE